MNKITKLYILNIDGEGMYNQFDDKNIGRRLKSIRTNKGLTQREVELSAGLRNKTLFDYESSRTKVSISIAIKLCNIYECTLEELLGVTRSKKKSKKESAPKSKTHMFMPLFQTGITSKDYYIVHHKLISDPYIMTELGLNKVHKRQSPYDSLTKSISKNKKRKMTIEILKYISSLINADGRISEEELSLKASMINNLEFELTDNEIRAINKAGFSLYLNKSATAVFTTKADQRFLIWILLLAAYSDNELNPKELSYIKKVSKNFGLKPEDTQYIQESIESTLT